MIVHPEILQLNQIFSKFKNETYKHNSWKKKYEINKVKPDCFNDILSSDQELRRHKMSNLENIHCFFQHVNSMYVKVFSYHPKILQFFEIILKKKQEFIQDISLLTQNEIYTQEDKKRMNIVISEIHKYDEQHEKKIDNVLHHMFIPEIKDIIKEFI